MVHHRPHAPINPAPIGPWKCNVCNAKFTDIKAHVQHMGSHALDYPSSCQLCLSRFKNSSDLGSHACVANNRARRTSQNSSDKPAKPKPTEPKEQIIPGTSFEKVPEEEASDDEDIESRINHDLQKRKRKTRESIESNNNHSDPGTPEFFVKDPWQASSALIDEVEEGEEDMAIDNAQSVPLNVIDSNKSPLTQVEINDFIEELIQPPENLLQSRRLNEKRRGRSRLRSSSASLHMGNTLRGGSSPDKAAQLVHDSSPEVTRGGIVAPLIQINQSPSTFESMADTTGFEDPAAIASGTPNHPEEDPDEESDPVTEFQFKNYICTKCSLKFFEYRSWANHLVTTHIDTTPAPEVLIKNIDALHPERISYVLRKNKKGNYSVSVKKFKEQKSPESPAEPKKEALKLTLCRTAGTYVLKRKSTDSAEVPCDHASEPKRLSRSNSTSSSGNEPSKILLDNLKTPPPPEKEECQPPVQSPPEPEVVTEAKSSPNISKGVEKLQAQVETNEKEEEVEKETSVQNNTLNNDNGRTNNQNSKVLRFLNVAKNVLRQLKEMPRAEIKTDAKTDSTLELEPGARKDGERSSTGEKPATSKETMTSSSNNSRNSSPKPQSRPGSNTEKDRQLPIRSASEEMIPNQSQSQKNAVEKTPPKVPEGEASPNAPSPDKAKELNKKQVDKPDLNNSSNNTKDDSSTIIEENPKQKERKTPENASMPNILDPEDNNAGVEKSGGRGEENVEDDENRLVIDTETEEVTQKGGKPLSGGSSGGQNERPGSASSVKSNELRKSLSQEEDDKNKSPGEVGSKNASPENAGKENEKETEEEVNEDLRCRICKEMFSNDEELNEHFSETHFRPVGNSILEPESPFPTVTVEGTSEIFEDEVEDTMPFPVETQLVELPTTAAPQARRNSMERREAAEYQQERSEGPVQAPVGQFRVPMTRAPVSIERTMPPPRVTQDGRIVMGPPEPQGRPQGFPTALHQALVRAQSGQQPPPPQLRPMPSIHLRGVMPSQQPQSRPSLARVPNSSGQFTQQVSGQPRNPQSILRPSSQPIHQIDEGVASVQEELNKIEEEIRQVEILASQQNNPMSRSALLQRKNDLMRYQQVVLNQLRAKREQDFLRRQQLNQLNQQNIQQQQMRQQQLHQARMQQPSNHIPPHVNPALLNSNGKRPGEDVDMHRAKQLRLEALLTERHLQANEAMQRTNNVTIRPVIQPQGSPTITVASGALSGGSGGSRHSSGTTSPAAVSPSQPLQRLGVNGIPLSTSPAAPLPPLTPPENPNLSPISDSGSPRGSPKLTVNNLIQMAVANVSPISSPRLPNTNQSNPHGGFVMPRAPPPAVRINSDGTVVTNHSAERPDRPPTIDLTDDEVHSHNAQMRATGRGVVSKEQAQLHEEALQRRFNIPGTSHFTIRPVPNNTATATSQRPEAATNKALICRYCQVQFSSVEVMNDHILRIHQPNRQHQPVSPVQQNFRAPHPPQQQQSGVLVRRPSPPNLPRPTNVIQHASATPSPPRAQVRERVPTPPANVQRQQSPSSRVPSSPKDTPNLVIPLLNLENLDARKIQVLNEIGVMSIIPLEGVRSLGIPLLSLRPDIPLGHFPHDTALEIGQTYQLPTVRPAGQDGPRAPSAPLPPRRTPPVQPSHPAPPPQRPQSQPSVISPPMGTVCTDRSCPDLVRRPSPTSVIHHMSQHNHQVTIRPVVQTQQQTPNANVQYAHQRGSTSHHESFLGGNRGNQFGGNRH